MLATLTARRLGIGSVEAIPWGRHVCHLFQDQSDLVALLVPYFVAGLAHNECCIWVAPYSLSVKEALELLLQIAPACQSYVQSGQLEVHPYVGWYSNNGRFDADHAMERWSDRLRAALDEGYDGLRLSGSALWLEHPQNWKDFSEYERALQQHLVGSRILALFTYQLDQCPATDLLEMARHHGRVMVRCEQTYELIQKPRPPLLVGPGIEQLGLTPRETEVLRWVAEGKVTSEVGSILAISPRTVQKHLDRIYQKLGVEGRTAAALRGVELLRGPTFSP
jgi:DNA-binding CsgD family transcriptional regulator